MQTEELEFPNPLEDSGSISLDTLTEEMFYPLVDTGFVAFYSNEKVIKEPSEGTDFYGQDATYQRNIKSYTLNEDGSVTDQVTVVVKQQVKIDILIPIILFSL